MLVFAGLWRCFGRLFLNLVLEVCRQLLQEDRRGKISLRNSAPVEGGRTSLSTGYASGQAIKGPA